MFNPGDLVRTDTTLTLFNGMGIVVNYDFEMKHFNICLQGYKLPMPFTYNEIVLLQRNN